MGEGKGNDEGRATRRGEVQRVGPELRKSRDRTGTFPAAVKFSLVLVHHHLPARRALAIRPRVVHLLDPFAVTAAAAAPPSASSWPDAAYDASRRQPPMHIAYWRRRRRPRSPSPSPPLSPPAAHIVRAGDLYTPASAAANSRADRCVTWRVHVAHVHRSFISAVGRACA